MSFFVDAKFCVWFFFAHRRFCCDAFVRLINIFQWIDAIWSIAFVHIHITKDVIKPFVKFLIIHSIICVIKSDYRTNYSPHHSRCASKIILFSSLNWIRTIMALKFWIKTKIGNDLGMQFKDLCTNCTDIALSFIHFFYQLKIDVKCTFLIHHLMTRFHYYNVALFVILTVCRKTSVFFVLKRLLSFESQQTMKANGIRYIWVTEEQKRITQSEWLEVITDKLSRVNIGFW